MSLFTFPSPFLSSSEFEQELYISSNCPKGMQPFSLYLLNPPLQILACTSCKKYFASFPNFGCVFICCAHRRVINNTRYNHHIRT